jgi:predicted phosphoribosyltransferase
MKPALEMNFNFKDRADAGRQIVNTFRTEVSSFDLLIVVLPAAAEIALAFATETQTPMRDLVIGRSATGVVIPRLTNVSGLNVAVIDDGVETGTTAIAIGAMLRAELVSSATLIVPVCPQLVVPNLLAVYDTVHTVVSPLEPESLRLHYEVN